MVISGGIEVNLDKSLIVKSKIQHDPQTKIENKIHGIMCPARAGL